MEITLPWFVALVTFGLFAFVWAWLDHRWMLGRIDDVSDDLDRHRDTANGRLMKAEDWIRHLDQRTRGQAGAAPEPYEPEPVFATPVIEVMHVEAQETNPATVPITVPDDGPPTLPDLKEAAKVAPPETTAIDAMYAEAMAAIDAIGKVER